MKLSQNAKTIISVIALASVTCLFLFMNCSLSEDFLSENGPEISGNPPYVYTDPNPPGGFPDPDNPKTKGNIKWLHGNTDISEWKRTSEITDIEIKVQNGQVCIIHSKKGQWPPKSAQARLDPIVTEPVEGNPWIIVPIKGKGYAATYDWLRAGEPCHMLDVGSLQNLYNSDKSLGKRTHKSPLTGWIPVPGDKVGLMVSGLARNTVRNVQERSDMLVVTLPDKNGDIPQEVEKPCSQDPNSSLCEECNIPNRTSVIKAIADKYKETPEKAYQLRRDYIADGAGSISNEDPRWEFMNRVVDTLHGTDERWGWTCRTRNNCDDILTDTIAYACGPEKPSESTSIFTVNIIGDDKTLGWNIVNDPNEKENDDTEDGDTANDGNTRNSGGDNTGGGTGNPGNNAGNGGDGAGTPGTGQADPGSQGSRAIAMSTDNTEDDSGPGWLYPRPGAIEYGCTDDEGNLPDEQLNLVEDVAAKFVDVYKEDVGRENVSKFTEEVAKCLKERVNSNWGRLSRDSGLTDKDVVAFDVGGRPPISVTIMSEASELQWLVVESPSGVCGDMGGAFQAVQGECILEDSDDEGEPCPEKLVNDNTHRTVNGKCLPRCAFFKETNEEEVKIGLGDECDDTTNYNILEIKGTVEGSGDSPQKCCRKSSKRPCPDSYEFVTEEGECRPSCNKAAKLAGYRYGIKHDKGIFRTDSCQARNEKDFDFYDPYNFENLDSTQVHEVLNSDTGFISKNYYCCVSGTPGQGQQGYDSKGWHPNDRVPTSTSSSGSTTTSTTTST